MGLGKKLGKKPRDVAVSIVDGLDTTGLCNKVEIAGPGFINLSLSDDCILEQLTKMDRKRFGVAQATSSQRIVVDYSSPNVAKEMHVGHLRSTVIGDCIARVLAFLGHTVIRQNHIGDWGTQFGMLIESLLDSSEQDLVVGEGLTELYQAAKKRFDCDTEFADRARKRVVALQGGDPEATDVWRRLVDQSRTYFQGVYQRLDVTLSADDDRGESFYNAQLPTVVEDLKKEGLLATSQGADVVFPKGFVDREGNNQAMIVRKSDGGYLYATTDLAAARYRVDQLKADRIVYVTDARQSQHFALVFATLLQVGWVSDSIRLEHVPFGTVLGKDNKPFKTREGGTVKLIDLLDEAQKRAKAIIQQKNSGLDESQQQQIAHAVGIGALKYADLSSDRIKDYVFDWDRMLSFEGNTAPYLQNAFVRIQSIFRKGGIDEAGLNHESIILGQPAERALGIKLLALPAVINAVAESLEPHRLCTYLYELASAFHQFYENCPVLTANSDEARISRLALCSLVGRTLAKGLDLLGIRVIERM